MRKKGSRNQENTVLFFTVFYKAFFSLGSHFICYLEGILSTPSVQCPRFSDEKTKSPISDLPKAKQPSNGYWEKPIISQKALASIHLTSLLSFSTLLVSGNQTQCQLGPCPAKSQKAQFSQGPCGDPSYPGRESAVHCRFLARPSPGLGTLKISH